MPCNCGKKKTATQPAKRIVKAPVGKPTNNGGASVTRRFIRRAAK